MKEERSYTIVSHSKLILLITGTSGCGKTTVAHALKNGLPEPSTSIHFFDDIGIPKFEEMMEKHGNPLQWQEWATHTWIDKLSQIAHKQLIILEGSFYPEFAVNKLESLGIENYLIVCLYVDKWIREQRLINERHQPELASQEMENYAQALTMQTEKLGGVVIDASYKTVAEVVTEIRTIIKKVSET